MNKEKMEEIILHLDSYFEQAMGTEVTREDWVNLRKELSTLIQEEREEAVRGFEESIFFGDTIRVDGKVYVSMEHIQKVKETYLQSLDKGDTDENR